MPLSGIIPYPGYLYYNLAGLTAVPTGKQVFLLIQDKTC